MKHTETVKLWCLETLNYARFYFRTFACNFLAFSTNVAFICSSRLPAFENCSFLKAGRKTHMEKKRRFLSPSTLTTVYFFRFTLFFLLTWQRDNPSRFTSSEFTFATFRTTYLILKSYMAEWYHSRMSGISAFPEGCDVFRLHTSGFDKARGAGDFVGQGGTYKNRILKYVVGSCGLDSVIKKGGGVLGLRYGMWE